MGREHLLEDYPDFCGIYQPAERNSEPKALHEEGELADTAWGKTRSWTLSGHFHETWQNDLIHINEALSGWPVKVDYIDFEDIREQGAF